MFARQLRADRMSCLFAQNWTHPHSSVRIYALAFVVEDKAKEWMLDDIGLNQFSTLG